MKKLLFSLLLALVAIGANAQGFGGRMNPEEFAKRQVDRIKEACGTTDDQYKKIYDLYLEQHKAKAAQMDSIMKSGNQGERPRFNREEMMARQNAMNEKIKAILTTEQYAKYEELQKQQRERMRQGGFGRRNSQ